MTSDREGRLSALLSSATLVLVGSVLASVSKILERILLGRFLSVDAYGEVSVAIALLSLGVTVSMFGFTQGIPRYMGRYDDEADVRGAWLTGLVVAATLALATAAVLLLAGDVVAGALFDSPDAGGLVRLFVLAIPLVVGLRVGVGGIRGMENTRYRLYVRDLLYPLSRIGLLVALLTLGFGVEAAGYAYLLAAGAAFLLAHVLLRRLLPLVGEVRLHTREMVAFSAPLLFSTILSVLLTRTDTLMLGYFASSFDVGLYSAAYPLANGMLLVLSSFGFLYLPLASRLDADGERDEVEAIYTLTTKWIYVVTFPAFLLFVAFPGDVLSIFFGERYARGAPALALLTLGFFTNAAYGRNRETLSALGATTFVFLANAVAFGINIGLNLLLIPRYSFMGAAVASAVSYVGLNLCIYAVLRTKFDITPFSSWSLRTFLVLPLVLLPPTLVLSRWISVSVVTMPVALVLFGAASVAVVSVTGCLQPEDRIALEFVEDHLGVRLPLVRRYLPSSG